VLEWVRNHQQQPLSRREFERQFAGTDKQFGASAPQLRRILTEAIEAKVLAEKCWTALGRRKRYVLCLPGDRATEEL
jgi:hypothetical protein